MHAHFVSAGLCTHELSSKLLLRNIGGRDAQPWLFSKMLAKLNVCNSEVCFCFKHLEMSISIVNEKKRVVDNILKAITVSGVLLVSIVYVRDSAVELSVYNTVFNSGILILMLVILFAGRSIDYEKKTWVIICCFIGLGVKTMLINGTAEAGFYLFILSSMVALLILDKYQANIVVILSSLAYGIIIALFAFDWIDPVIDNTALEGSKVIWVVRICMYVFLLFIVIGGVGRLQHLFIKTIEELNISNQKLNHYNEQLREQLIYTQQVENKMTEKEVNFKKLFEESNDGIIVCDADGRILEANNTVSTLLNYPKSALIGSRSSDFVISDDKRLIQQLSIDKIHRAKIRELHLQDKEGNRVPVEVNYSTLNFNEQKSILVTIRDIRERRQTEQKVLHAVIQAEENERARFAKDLHDDLGPILSSIKMYIQSLRQPDDAAEKKELISKLISTVDDSIKSIRKISYNLSSHLLQNAGLINALKTHVDRINLSNTFHITFDHNFHIDFRLSSNIEIVIYRVLLELINNSITHSQGNQINIELMLRENHFVILYRDNGTGFDMDRILRDNSKGIGLKNILSRLNSINGLLHFHTPKNGFSLNIDIGL
jgi:PAS domain S-box-containing protein